MEHGFRAEMSMWNAAMASSLVELTRMLTHALLSPTMDMCATRALYDRNMDVVRGMSMFSHLKNSFRPNHMEYTYGSMVVQVLQNT